LLACCFTKLFSNEIVIERPPFNVRNHSCVEIEKIVLTDKATVLHITAYGDPKFWIKFSPETYIRANNQEYTVISADGINLDEEIFVNESGKIAFSMTFPPIDPNTEQIDFIESNCEGCFKTWGIELKSDTLTHRIRIPESITNRIADPRDQTPLQTQTFRDENAIIKGQIIGYVPEMISDIIFYVNNPITGTQKEYDQFVIQKDGTFEAALPVVCTTTVLLRIPQLINEWIMVSPGKESTIYFDLQQKNCQEGRTRKDKCPDSQWVFFGGANADINEQYHEYSISNYISGYLDYRKMMDDVSEMSPDQYKTYLLNKMNQAIEGLQKLNLSQKVQELAEIEVRLNTLSFLMGADYCLLQAYKQAHHLKYEDEAPDYKQPVFNLQYYDFLKEFPVNNSLALYNGSYSWAVSSCKYIQNRLSQTDFHVNAITDYMMQSLIDSGKLSSEDIITAKKIQQEAFENWDKKTIKNYKKESKLYLKKLSDRGKLPNELHTLIAKINQLIDQKENVIAEIKDFSYELNYKLEKKAIFTKEELEAIEKSVYKQKKEAVDADEKSAFMEKYDQEIKLLFVAQNIKEIQDCLEKILGINNGILFDLVKTQTYAKKLEEYTPLEDELKPISQMENPFYLEYFTKKNNQLLVQIEENKNKKGYNVFDTPEAAEDELFHELMKPFEGKVILVDFWATWCGPCRDAMKKLEPAKEDLINKGVVFVYLTDESSPLATWQNMIPNIHGNHYRLTGKQFDYLKRKFGVRGVPSYLVLNKKGEQVYFKVGFEGVDVFTKMLNRELEAR
jgi:thiol-disulfide isomerase/thioredoxin